MSVCLSVLIPAYGYADGVKRILSNFRPDASGALEILISDDSLDDQVSQVVDDFSRHYRGKLRYRRNQPARGAVANWNSLLDWASGEYVLLLHHDEYPLGGRFVPRALGLLTTAPEADVFVMECILGASTGQRMRPHLPRMLREQVIKHFPGYLFKRNVVGPVSCVIARRALYPRFDETLRWLVDVDVYFRLRQATARWCVRGDLQICTTLGRKDSITASIKDELKELDARERAYLCQKHPEPKIWLAPRKFVILNMLERVAWVAMRMVTHLCYWFIYSLGATPVSASDLQSPKK